MSCIYCDFEGKCSMFDEDYMEGMGYDSFGNCVVDDDPVPGDNCQDYESSFDGEEDVC